MKAFPASQVFTLILCALGPSACSQGPGADVAVGSDVPPIKAVAEPGAEVPKAVSTYTYAVQAPPPNYPLAHEVTTLIPRDPSQYWCVLSQVKGRLKVQWDHIRLVVGGAGYEAATAGATAGAVRCVSHANFVADAGSVNWLSDAVTAGSDGARSSGDTANLWWGSAASYITQVRGTFNGGGEYIEIRQSTSGTTPSVLATHTLARDVYGSAHSYFVGVPQSGKLVKLYGFRNGAWVRGTVNSSGTFEFKVSTVSGFSSYWLPPQDKAFCYLTRVSGDIGDIGGATSEEVLIDAKGGNWFLSATSSDGKPVYGSVRCMAYDQRT